MKQYADLETGEIVEGNLKTKQMQEIIDNEKRKQTIKDAQGTEKHSFYFANMETAKEITKMLTQKELGYFLVMQCYINYDNMLKMDNEAKLPMTKPELMKVLKIKKPHTVNALIKHFVELGLVIEGSTDLYGKQYKAFFLDKKYCFRKDVNSRSSVKKTVKVFMDTVKELYAEGKIKPADVGFVYKIIPFVNYHHNLITANPYEKDATKDEALSIVNIARALEMDAKEVAKKLNSVKWGNMSVFARIKVGKETMIKVNPLVIWRQEGYPPASLYTEFIIGLNKKK